MIASRTDCQPWVAADAVEWQAPDMTAVFGADTPWNALPHPALWLPVDCQGDPAAPVGQLIEHNATGPLRLGYGGWRDLLLGCQFQNGRGELITAGGRTVKNVAGYDLTKFMVGQGGVFGRITAVTARVYLKPDDALMASFPPDLELFNRLLISACRPQWAVLTAFALTCGYLGPARAVDYYQQQLPAHQPLRLERAGFEADVKWRMQHWTVPAGDGAAMRAAVPPMRVAEFAAAANLSNWTADPAHGVVLFRNTPAAAAAAHNVGGRVRDGARGLFGDDELAILRRLKHAFDPGNHRVPLTPLNA